MAVTALGVFVPDLLWQKVHRRTLSPAGAGDWSRSLTKLVGLVGSVGCIALLYWLFPEYGAQGLLRQLLGSAQGRAAAVGARIPALHPLGRSTACASRTMRSGRWVGCCSLRWQDVSGRAIGQHLLGWLVKGYYLPLMFTYFCNNLDKLLHYDLKLLTGFKGYYDWAYFTLYFIDVALVSMTYLMSLKLTDTHIRSTEPTAFGWLVGTDLLRAVLVADRHSVHRLRQRSRVGLLVRRLTVRSMRCGAR